MLLLQLLYFIMLTNIQASQEQSDSYKWIDKSYSKYFNETSNNFGAVLNDGNKTYVGGENYMLVIDRYMPSSQQKILFDRDSAILKACENTNRDGGTECSNVIVAIEKINSTFLFVCGTHIQNPRCYFFNVKNLSITMAQNKYGKLIPKSANANIAIAIVNQATALIIYFAVCSRRRNSCNFYRTSNTSTLHVYRNSKFPIFQNPVFLNTYTFGSSNAYVFYRDMSNMFQSDGFTSDFNQNRASSFYGMVMRVCQSDMGGPSTYNENFMTSMRARLLCPNPGRKLSGTLNVYFNYLESTNRIDDMVYALYTFPRSWNIPASAVCVYSLKTIEEFIDGKVFPDKKTKYYVKELEIYNETYPGNGPFLPGQCPNSSQSTERVVAQFYAFVTKGPVIGRGILPVNGIPSYFNSNHTFKFIAVAKTGNYHVIHLVTEDGRFKRIRVGANGSEPYVVLSNFKLLNISEDIISISLTKSNTLILVTEKNVFEIKTAVCSAYNDCSSCEADPYCDWVLENEKFICIAGSNKSYNVRSCVRPPNPPTQIKVFKAPSFVEISWIPGASARSASSLKYPTELRNIHGRAMFRKIAAQPSLQIKYSLLEDGRKYIFSLHAANEGSLSVSVQKEFETALQVPSITKTTEVKDTSATLTWKTVHLATFYNVSVYQSKSNTTISSYHITNLPKFDYQSVTIGRLQATNEYHVVVFAVSEDRVISPSSSLTFRTEKTHNSNLFVVIIMVLLIILILITVVLCQNMYVIGTNTRKLTTERGKTLCRRWIFFWFASDLNINDSRKRNSEASTIDDNNTESNEETAFNKN